MKRILTLWEIMNKFNSAALVVCTNLVSTNSASLNWAMKIKPEAKITSEIIANTHNVLDQCKVLWRSSTANGVNLGRMFHAMEVLETHLKILGAGMLIASLEADLCQLERAMILDCNDFKFVPIRKEDLETFDQEHLFGEEVSKRFPKAVNDIRDAGNSIAVGLYTASVFHLMRAAEYGLRALAKRLRVQILDKAQPQPFEYATWNKVITETKNKINAVRQLPQSKRKNDQLNFYSDMADRCTYIRDSYRNDVSHTRKEYNRGEALGALERVRDFMQKLAKGLS